MVRSIINNTCTGNAFRSGFDHYKDSSEGIILLCDVIMVLTSIVGLAGNISVCICVCKTRHLRTHMNVNLVSSCVVNIIGCACLLPIRIELYTGYSDCATVGLLCRFGTFFRTVCDTLQLFMLTMASFDRYQAVVNPFKKVGLKKRSAIMVAISWTLSLTLGAISAVFFIDSALFVPCSFVVGAPNWGEYDAYFIFPLGLTLLCIIAVLYGLVLNTLFKNALNMARHRTKNRVSPSMPNVHTGIISGKSENDEKQKSSVSTSNLQCANVSFRNVHLFESNDSVISGSTNESTITIRTSKMANTKMDIKRPNEIDETSASVSNNKPLVLVLQSSSSSTSPSNTLHVPNKGNTINETGYAHSSVDVRSVATSSSRDKTIQVVVTDGSVKMTRTKNNKISGAVCMMNTQNKETGRRRIELKASKRIAMLIGTFMCCWLPLPVFVISISGYTTLSEAMFRVLLVLATLGSSFIAVNPILYGLINRQLNSALGRLLNIRKLPCLKVKPRTVIT